MKIQPEIREQWTRWLQGQLSIDEQQQLLTQLETQPELAMTLASDAELHQLLLDHYGKQPNFQDTLPKSAAQSASMADDEVFVSRCVQAVVASPPSFELLNEITFIEPDAVPPIAIVPPPVCHQSDLADFSQRRPFSFGRLLVRTGSWLAVIAVLLLALLGGSSLYFPQGNATWLALLHRNRVPDQVGADASGPQAQQPIAQQPIIEPLDENAAVQDPQQVEAEAEIHEGLPEIAGANPPRIREPEFPVIMRGRDEEEPNFIKDDLEMPAAPVLTNLPFGQVLASPDAQWHNQPTAWAANQPPVRLQRGEARLTLQCGLTIGFRAPASLQFRSPTDIKLLNGDFWMESAPDDDPPAWSIETAAIKLQPQSSMQLLVSESSDLGTQVEVMTGQAQLVPWERRSDGVSLSSEGLAFCHAFPALANQAKYPAAIAAAGANSFSATLLVHDTRLKFSAPQVFSDTLETVTRRLREAPDGLADNWRSVVNKLERLKVAGRHRPGINHAIKESGDLLPAFTELRRELAQGLGVGIGGPLDNQAMREFAGQININGRNVDLNNIDEVRKFQREVMEEMRAITARNRAGRRPRNPADPDVMVDQMLEMQQRQLQVMADIMDRFGRDAMALGPLADNAAAAADPVLDSFRGLMTAEGQQKRVDRREALLQALRAGLETDDERAQRLREMRDRLHEAGD